MVEICVGCDDWGMGDDDGGTRARERIERGERERSGGGEFVNVYGLWCGVIGGRGVWIDVVDGVYGVCGVCEYWVE